VRAVLRQHLNLLVDVFLQQLVGGHEIVLVVLLQNSGFGIRDRLELHAGPVDLRRHIGKSHHADLLIDVDLASLTDHAEVLVVDRERHTFFRLIDSESGRGGKNSGQRNHQPA